MRLKHFALFLLCGALARGAGTVTQTIGKLGNTDSFLITLSWTADASNGSVPSTALVQAGADIATTDGYSIIAVVTDPGSPAPTDLYDITLTDANGLDIMEAACANRSTTITETCSAPPHLIAGTTTFNLSGNSVNSAAGTVKITLVRQTVAKRNTPSTGTTYTAGSGIVISGNSIATDSAVIPRFSTGAGAPAAACVAGAEFYLDTTNTRFFRCSATNTWMEVARISSGSGAPSSGACDAAAEVGGLYYRTDNTSAAPAHYGCAQSGSGTYSWVLLGGGGSTNTHTIWLPAGTRDNTTNRYLWQMNTPTIAALGSIPNLFPVIAFADAAVTTAGSHFVLPAAWNSGTVNARIFWSVSSSVSTSWRAIMRIGCLGAGDNATTPSFNADSAQTLAYGGSQNVISISSFSSLAMTNCSPGEIALVNVERDGTHGADDMTQSVSMIGTEVTLTRNN